MIFLKGTDIIFYSTFSGDFKWKRTNPGIVNEWSLTALEPGKRPQVFHAIYHLLTAEPFLNTIELNLNDHLCLIGSDGFWDAMPDALVLEICLCLRTSTVDEICSALVQRACERRPDLQVQDDITSVVIDLRPARTRRRLSLHESDEKSVEFLV